MKTEGESVTFKAPVQNGLLTWNGEYIAEVSNGDCTVYKEHFKDRVEWRNNKFNINDLVSADSGTYRVKDNDGQRSVSEFHLFMRAPVKKTEGDSVTFEAPVWNGALKWKGEVIAEVSSGQCVVKSGQFTGRVEWKDTFQINNVNVGDSGVYTVQNKEGRKTCRGFDLIVRGKEQPGDPSEETPFLRGQDPLHSPHDVIVMSQLGKSSTDCSTRPEHKPASAQEQVVDQVINWIDHNGKTALNFEQLDEVELDSILADTAETY
ncbi:uncharacterized protein LOC136764459 [Amia ocellicauda]|uniref:uncharacterized protein LOC136764459 n=1 Tax=Amia ocellicauda TaxID=2972642 RepID=UPI003463B47C